MKSQSQLRSSLKNFKVTDVIFHRNGVGGRSFYNVRFSFTQDEHFMPNMLAITPCDAKLGNEDVECFVINVSDPTSCWRGAHFVDDVNAAVKAFNRDSESKFRALVGTKKA